VKTDLSACERGRKLDSTKEHVMRRLRLPQHCLRFSKVSQKVSAQTQRRENERARDQRENGKRAAACEPFARLKSSPRLIVLGDQDMNICNRRREGSRLHRNSKSLPPSCQTELRKRKLWKKKS